MNWNIESPEIWMMLGFFLIFVELIKLPGLGLLFLGLGSLSVAILLASEKIALNFSLQFLSLAVFTIIWFIILWKPLKNLNSKVSSKKIYNDLIGDEVIVIGDKISPGLMGQVKWSGTIMNATLNSSESRTAKIGETLIVQEVMGNVLICNFK